MRLPIESVYMVIVVLSVSSSKYLFLLVQLQQSVYVVVVESMVFHSESSELELITSFRNDLSVSHELLLYT